MSDWHNHTCELCGFVFRCNDPNQAYKPVEKCLTTRAAKSNGAGPFCPLCRHLEMAKRYAEARGFTLEESVLFFNEAPTKLSGSQSSNARPRTG